MANERPTVSGPQGAMIYLAESLAGVKNAQDTTNQLLRELIELARVGAQSNFAEQPQDEEPDEIAQLKGLLVPNPNGAPAPK